MFSVLTAFLFLEPALPKTHVALGSCVHTFRGSEIEVEIDDVGAVLVAGSGAKLLREVWFQECVRGNADGVAVHAAYAHALLRLYPIPQPLHHYLRRPALVHRVPATVLAALEQAPVG